MSLDRRNMMFDLGSSLGVIFYGAGTACQKLGDMDTLAFRRCAGKIEHLIYPGFSTCGRCGRPWATVEGHSTKFSASEGCFPLCEKCWSELSPAQRLPFYRALNEQWLQDAHYFKGDERRKYLAYVQQKWPLVEAAVLAGK